MTDTTETAQAAKSVAIEIGKFAVKSAAQTAVEVTAAVAILATVGFVSQKVSDRRAKKALVTPEESK